jgi:dTMP kinase
MKGLLITFEGGDGAGKTTLIESVYRTLNEQGRNVLLTRAPGGTPAGVEIRKLLLNGGEIPLTSRAELFLFLADRAEHVDRTIRPQLEKGTIILCDRFNDSTIAYQGVARNLSADKVAELCDFACNGLSPDLTLYLNLDPEIGLERVRREGKGADRIEAEELAFHKKIQSAYLGLAKQDPDRLKVLDASLSKETLHQKAMELIDECLPQPTR